MGWRVWGLGFGVEGLGLGVWDWRLVEDSRFRSDLVEDSRFRIWGDLPDAKAFSEHMYRTITQYTYRTHFGFWVSGFGVRV